MSADEAVGRRNAGAGAAGWMRREGVGAEMTRGREKVEHLAGDRSQGLGV